MNLPSLPRSIILSAFLVGAGSAEEGGSGHYIPGSMSSFVDGVPPDEALIARYNFVYYGGDIAGHRSVPIAGLAAFGADAESFANGLTMLWRPQFDLGEKWSYAMSATVPYVSMSVTADVDGLSRTDEIDGIGDTVFMPIMTNYKVNGDFNINTRLGIYAPTGSYKSGRLANTGKNFWTFEPAVGLMYFGQDSGIEASLFTGIDFNTTNQATDYRSGTQFHIDATLAQHFPLFNGIAGIGANGYWYHQLSGDSGGGATFGDFRSTTAGVGPAISYTTNLGGVDLIAEVKWIPELHTRRRLEGDYIWLKFVLKF